MAQIEQSDKGGKKKKGAQKKMAIHVDFTPMVDMNMLLITFFMLCTTMIKSQTLQIALPSNKEDIKKEEQSQAKSDEAVTLILDTEYDESGKPAKVGEGEAQKTKHLIYYYFGKPDTVNAVAGVDGFLNLEEFKGYVDGEPQGIRKILYEKNKEVMKDYLVLKARWKNKEIDREEFDAEAKKIRTDSTKTRPVVVIKPGPNTTYEGLINALDEMQINQIARYQIELPTRVDSILLDGYNRLHPKN